MYKNILVPLDGSELAECVLPHVQSIAKGCGVDMIMFVRVAETVKRLEAEKVPWRAVSPEEFEELRLQEERYRLGAATLLELIEAQVGLTRARTSEAGKLRSVETS